MSYLTIKKEFGEQGFLKVSTVAEMLDKSPRTIKRWCDKKVFRWMKHHDDTRGIDRDYVMEYLKKNEQ